MPVGLSDDPGHVPGCWSRRLVTVVEGELVHGARTGSTRRAQTEVMMGFLEWLGKRWAKRLDFTAVDSVLKAEALAAEGKLTPLYLVPLRFGGQEMPMNRVFVPASVVERKDLHDERVEQLVNEHRADGYSCTPEYRGSSVVPCRLDGMATEEGIPVYPWSIDVW